ncbi:uncharacterized protein LOC110182790 isoform X1 [Drosophila serrata]|uniref:uncharacterized protein LOC110182790 isoform X1 n=1 Tax=Drosophila serrata TaxID=7274 RepID=UPI000A1D0E6F|nr:uncharacterized protein LOC110182790 isoform X1 [Drosophila serrata]
MEKSQLLNIKNFLQEFNDRLKNLGSKFISVIHSILGNGLTSDIPSLMEIKSELTELEERLEYFKTHYNQYRQQNLLKKNISGNEMGSLESGFDSASGDTNLLEREIDGEVATEAEEVSPIVDDSDNLNNDDN